MLKSMMVRYLALTAAVVTTSSVILSATANLQSQSQPQNQNQISSAPKTELPPANKLAELSPPDQMAERPNAPDMLSGKMLKQLNLTPEQLKKLKEVRDRDQGKMRELAQQSRQANKELRDLMAGNESNDALRTKHNQVLTLQQELQKQHFERMLAMREILTPQQRSQLNEMMSKNRNRMRDNMREGMRDRMEKRMEKREEMRDRATL
ncbi:Spy/CpxP family protein refolding chaperone [Pseudanabaena sp. FACHB-1998]|uniref:Spy/CpxP family protein refolding chaperone n=1 Tax=Pseudanabaena sp. FACHB-1998 TaxID=2692858 RepID=UPI001680BCBD|nr:Spy/CpxP family protein refolding chaperone [Pseudanabaena sp. FACHB-1998]MBD2178318.1 Spy/CpxP family protein refolding chaperone [Pseudanabaena sp. FACHB-1998]